METAEVTCLFKETRLSLEPPSPSSVVNIGVPSPNGRSAHQPGTDNGIAQDEVTFRRRILATSSAVYYRSGAHSPRTFLWRVLNEGTVLSIRSIDVHKDRSAPEAPLVLNFCFDVPIQPACVAFSDSPEHDTLYVFVLDEAQNLYCITLRPDFFRRRAILDGSAPDALKVYTLAEISGKHPHRLYAVGPDLLVVALHDGVLVRLERARAGEALGRAWKEQSLNSGGWGLGLRNLLSFSNKNSVRFGKATLDYATTTSAQISNLGLDGPQFLFAVSLDHKIRIWNLATGALVHVCDILGRERQQHEMGKWIIDPSHTALVQVADRGSGDWVCVTYSPVGAGEFKFWTVVMTDANTIGLEDQFPRYSFVPVNPSSTDVWTLADFVVARPATGHVQIWTLWKNNMTYRVQHLQLDRARIDTYWHAGWDIVHMDDASAGMPPDLSCGACEPTDVTEKWLRAILAPGRFTKATLETALSMYEQSLGVPKDAASKGRRSLAESICTVLASTVALERRGSGGMEYELFRKTSELQWRQFYRLVTELDKQRGEALALAFDREESMPWVVCADAVSAVRTASNLERACLTLSSPAHGSAGRLISAGLAFLDGFNDTATQLCRSALRPELFEEASKTDLERIQIFYDKCALWRNVTDEDCAQVVDVLGANFNLVTPSAYTRVLQLTACSPPPPHASRATARPATEFGRKLVVRATHELAELQWRVCFSQLVLLAHMEFEFEADEDALHNVVDIGAVFRKLVGILRRLELVRWLLGTEISVPAASMERGGPSSSSSSSPVRARGAGTAGENRQQQAMQTITALEGNVSHVIGFGSEPAFGESLAASITYIVQDLCAADGAVEIVPALVQAFFLRRDRADLAFELTPFCDREPFSVYVQGRVALALQDADEAAANFRKAATGMSSEHTQTERYTGGILDETEKSLLHHGLASYYRHIASLFEKARTYLYVLEFSRLAVQFLGTDAEGHPATRTEILSRMFNAATATSQFEVAHTSLQAMTDPALQHSCLRKLVDRMCETSHSAEMLALPFGRLRPHVDELLEQLCRAAGDVMRGPPYHQILYAWRVRFADYRGAASVLLDRIHKLRRAGEGERLLGDDGFDTPVTNQYLLLINVLSCVDESEAWIFSDVPRTEGEGVREGGAGAKRKVVTLADVRKEYQDELDRISAIQNNQFGIDVRDEMDVY